MTVTLTGTDDRGVPVNKVTQTIAGGAYSFTNLRPGVYQIAETQPGLPYVDGKDTIGTPGGSTSNDLFFNINLHCDVHGINNNFGERPGNDPDNGTLNGLTATIGFWHNKNGQQTLKMLGAASAAQAGTSTALGNWLATNFPNLYGAKAAVNFSGKNTAWIAARFTTLFNVQGQKLDAQTLAVAFAIYTTTTELNSTAAGQTTAAKFGFKLTSQASPLNLRNRLWNVGNNGEAFGTKVGSSYVSADNQSLSTWTLLQRANFFAVKGVLWPSALKFGATTFSSSALRTQGNDVFSNINEKGDIP